MISGLDRNRAGVVPSAEVIRADNLVTSVSGSTPALNILALTTRGYTGTAWLVRARAVFTADPHVGEYGAYLSESLRLLRHRAAVACVGKSPDVP